MDMMMETKMNYREFVKLVEARFGLGVSVYKEKAGGLMVDFKLDGQAYGDGYIVGPDCGHSLQNKNYGVTIDGWAYVLSGGEWFAADDGGFGWRRGPNPFPEIPVGGHYEE